MINIQNKQDCCGCSACVQRCPKQCISLHEDEEGFLYPEVELDVCIDCGLCEKVCPVLHQAEERVPLEVFAAKNPNEQIRMASSSGGVFTQLAEQTIEAGGVVFGVKWNEHFEAVHAYTETKETLAAFRGSKYVQSRIGDTFKQAEQFLKQGRQVLYSGTPCQIAGLRKFLRREYDNLLAVDIFCHSCPSPGVFRWYMSEILQKTKKIKIRKCSFLHPSLNKILPIDTLAENENIHIQQINFRDKSSGWKSYSFQLKYSIKDNVSSNTYTILGNDNAYMRGFLSGLYVRPSCFACPAKSGKSGSDITLGDYWGIQSLMPELDDDRGVSALTVNTEKGKQALHTTTAELHEAPYEDLCAKNPALVHSCRIPANRSRFFAPGTTNFHQRIQVLCRIPIRRRIKIKVRALLSKVLSKDTKQWIKQFIQK